MRSRVLDVEPRRAANRPGGGSRRRSTPPAPATGGCCSSGSPTIGLLSTSGPRAEVSDALRRLAGAGVRLGVFTDAPHELAVVATRQLGVERRVELIEAGPGALDRLRATLGYRDDGRLDARELSPQPTATTHRLVESRSMESRDVTDRQFDALLERLDRIAIQLERIDQRLEAQRGLPPRLPRATRAQRVAERARLRGARSVAAGPTPQQRTLTSARRAGRPSRCARRGTARRPCPDRTS